MICPHCGQSFPAPQQTKAGKARWANLTPEQRSALATTAANKRWGTPKPVPGAPAFKTKPRLRAIIDENGRRVWVPVEGSRHYGVIVSGIPVEPDKIEAHLTKLTTP